MMYTDWSGISAPGSSTSLRLFLSLRLSEGKIAALIYGITVYKDLLTV